MSGLEAQPADSSSTGIGTVAGRQSAQPQSSMAEIAATTPMRGRASRYSAISAPARAGQSSLPMNR